MRDALLARLTPRIIGLILGAAILALTGIIVLAIFKGAEVDLFGIRINARASASAPQPTGTMTAEQFIASLPAELRGTVEDARRNIEAVIAQSRQKSARLDDLERRVLDLEQKLSRVTAEKAALEQTIDDSQDKFFSQIQRLDREITRWEGSINTNVRVEEKTEIFRLIQQLLRRIGHYDGPIDADPARARAALVAYKQAKGFQDEQYWSYVTRETVIFMVRDYAETLLKESRG